MGGSPQVKFHSLVRGRKTQIFIKPECIGTHLIRSELQYMTPVIASALDRPLKQFAADALGPKPGCNPNALDQRTPAALIGEIRDIGQLHDAHDPGIHCGNNQLVIRIAINRFKCVEITLRQWQLETLSLSPKRVIGQHLNEGAHIVFLRRAELHS